MNTPNNKRKKESKKRIEKTFVNLIQSRKISEITVTDICKKAKLNRSTFYANYLDIYDLADKIKEKLEQEIEETYKDEIKKGYNSNDYLKLFKHIKENKLFYKTYFKLGFDNDYKITRYDVNLAKLRFDNKFIDYHMKFFQAGITAIIKQWLYNDCKETPEEINEILKDEYKFNHKY